MQIRKISEHATEGPDNTKKVLKDVYKAMKRNISYGGQGWNPQDPNNLATGMVTDNIDGAWGVINKTLLADTEFSVTHNLLRVPVGFHTVRQNAAGTFYDSGTPWTTTQIFLKFSSANPNATFFIF